MSIHITQVFDYLEAHPLTKHEGEFDSLLEMLHYIYTAANPIVTDSISCKGSLWRRMMPSMPGSATCVWNTSGWPLPTGLPWVCT